LQIRDLFGTAGQKPLPILNRPDELRRLAALCAILGLSSLALTLNAATLVAFVLAAFLARPKCGRDVVPVGAILTIALYIFAKLGLYPVKLFNKTDPQWTRTDRTKSE
jgi:hypothetical protein